MSRRWLLGLAALALVLLVVFAGRIGGALERWLLALHGAH